MIHYDLIVIGSGAGLKVAFAAAAKGFKTLLIEKEYLGGTCLNKGCIPSKMFIAPADFIESLKRSEMLNLSPLKAKADFASIANRTFLKINETRSNIKSKILQTKHLDLLQEQVSFSGDKKIETSRGLMTSAKIVIASGMLPQAPPIPGLNSTPFLTSSDVLNLKKLPKSALILGGGYIACEMAHYLSTFGTDITLMVRSKVLRKEDEETGNIFRTHFSKKITLMEKSLPEAITYKEQKFFVKLNGKEYIFDEVIAATGQVPATMTLQLDKTDVTSDQKGFIEVGGNLETSRDGIYALGDCIGHYFFRHSANFQAEYLIDHLFNSKTEAIKYPPMPHAVFSYPEIAGVGYTEEQLKEKKIPYVAGKALYKESNMGIARAYKDGQIKLLVSTENHKFLGVHIIGEDAATLIHSFVSAMTFDHTIDDYLKTIFIHPAMTEALKEAAIDARQNIK